MAADARTRSLMRLPVKRKTTGPKISLPNPLSHVLAARAGVAAGVIPMIGIQNPIQNSAQAVSPLPSTRGEMRYFQRAEELWEKASQARTSSRRRSMGAAPPTREQRLAWRREEQEEEAEEARREGRRSNGVPPLPPGVGAAAAAAAAAADSNGGVRGKRAGIASGGVRGGVEGARGRGGVGICDGGRGDDDAFGDEGRGIGGEVGEGLDRASVRSKVSERVPAL